MCKIQRPDVSDNVKVQATSKITNLYLDVMGILRLLVLTTFYDFEMRREMAPHQLNVFGRFLSPLKVSLGKSILEKFRGFLYTVCLLTVFFCYIDL